MSLVGVVTAVTSASVGAVVSVVVVVLSSSEVVVSSLVVDAPSSLLLAQEMIVRLKMNIRIIYKTFLIFLFQQ